MLLELDFEPATPAMGLVLFQDLRKTVFVVRCPAVRALVNDLVGFKEHAAHLARFDYLLYLLG